MFDLPVQKREKFGKAAKTLRQNGLVPAELYGRGLQNEHLTAAAKDFAKVFSAAGENTVINILIDGQPRSVLIYDVQRHPLSGEFLNVDFYAVKMDEKIRTEIPVVFTGEAPAIKAFNGILVKVIKEIEIEALPANLPKQLDVDLSGLDAIGKSIYVRDLKVIEGVKFLADFAAVIVTVKEPKEEEKIESAVPAGPSAAESAASQSPEAAAGSKSAPAAKNAPPSKPNKEDK